MNRLLKEMLVFGSAVIAGLYLINPTLGVLEFIPDNLPLIGNLDEVAAVALLLNALRYYGIDITKLFTREPASTSVIARGGADDHYPRVIGRNEAGEQLVADRNERGELVIIERKPRA